MNLLAVIDLLLSNAGGVFLKLKFDRIISPRLTYALLSLFKQPQTCIEFYGNKLILDLNDRLYFDIFKNRDALPLKLIAEKVSLGSKAVDVGAHIGCYTLLLAKLVGPQGKLYAFEPNPESFALLEKNVKLNGYQQVATIQKAVAERGKQAKLYLNRVEVAHSIYPGNKLYRGIPVDAVSLDEYFINEITGFNFIKIDAEGAEYSVLQGMQELLSKNSSLKIMIKYAPWLLKKSAVEPQLLLRSLWERGFKLYDVNEKNNQVKQVTIGELLRNYQAKRSSYTNLFCSKF